MEFKEMTTDKMREEIERIEAIAENKRDSVKLANFYKSYALELQNMHQAATTKSTAKLAQMQKQHANDCTLVRIAALECVKMQTELEAYRTMQRTDNSSVIAQMQARIDELEGVAEDLETYFQITKDLTSEIVEMQSRIDELVEAAKQFSRIIQLGSPSCQKSVVEQCVCTNCVSERFEALAKVKDVK